MDLIFEPKTWILKGQTMTELTSDEHAAIVAAIGAPGALPTEEMPPYDWRHERARRAEEHGGKATSLGAAIYSLGLYMDGCHRHRSLGYNGEAIVLGMDRNTPPATLRQIPNAVNGWPVRAFDSDNVVEGHTSWLKIGSDFNV